MKLPASGMCNMRCGYCFYEDEMKNRKQAENYISFPGTSFFHERNCFSVLQMIIPWKQYSYIWLAF